MSGYIEGKINTKQYSLIPMCYDEMISEDNCICQVKIDPFYKSILTPLR